LQDPESAYAQAIEPDDGSLYEEAGSVIQGRLSITDDQGYIMPSDVKTLNEEEYHVLEDPNEEEYNVLEDPNEQANSTETNSNQTPVFAETDPRYIPRTRRRPPSPPRNTNRGGSNAGTYYAGDRTSIYEDLIDSSRPRSVYEALDHSTLSRKC